MVVSKEHIKHSAMRFITGVAVMTTSAKVAKSLKAHSHSARNDVHSMNCCNKEDGYTYERTSSAGVSYQTSFCMP